ncbi:MAG: tyrosine-type recombinase/integrase [Truepera sp.]|nr:tyrosine-type recombinase/integrase [Truepera sp.]
MRAWLEASGLEDGPLFRPVSKSGLVATAALSARSVRRIIQARAEAAGVEGRVSGHSLRVGAAQSLAQAGASLVEMQQAGRWQSPSMPGHYARAELADRPEESDLGAVARLRYRK